VAVPATAASAPTPALRIVTPLPTPAAVTPAQSASIATQRLQDWAAAWMSHDVERYLAFYSLDFKPAKGSKAAWIDARHRLVGKPGAITVTLGNVQTHALSDTRVETSFDQDYTSANFRDTMHKTLTWDRVGSEWKIVGESNR
jgi:adhesin transport system outer membrane protein